MATDTTFGLLVGTRNGLHRFHGTATRDHWKALNPVLLGYDVYHAISDPRDGSIWAAANRDGVGRVMRSTDGGASWQPCGDPLPGDSVWHVEPGSSARPGSVFAGVRPANLFRSSDFGATWQPVLGLNEHPSRPSWMEGGGGLNLHTIILHPDRPDRIFAGISAAGLFRSDDDGQTWHPFNLGVDATICGSDAGLPDDPEVYRCVHKVVVDRDRPDVLFQQNHIGVYRSDNAGATWQPISRGLPTLFGFPVAIGAGPHAPVFVIPENMETVRTERQLEVWRTVDDGVTWEGSGIGLPYGEHNVLREALACDRLQPCGVYLGNKAGSVFVSADGGATFAEIASGLPGVRSVTVA